MSTVGELIPLPSAASAPVPVARRVVTLYPDSQRVWGHRMHRMPPPLREENGTYDAHAGLSERGPVGRLVDVYA